MRMHQEMEKSRVFSEGFLENNTPVSKDIVEQTIQSKLSQLTEVNKILKRKIFDFYTIFEIGKELNSNLKLKDLLDKFLGFCIVQTGAEWAVILTQERPHQKRFLYFKSYGKSIKKQIGLDSKSLLFEILKSQPKPQFLEEIQIELKSKAGKKKSFFERKFLEELKPELIVPLLTKGKIRGVLFLSKKSSGLPFFESDLEFLGLLSEKGAVALENALLYQSEKVVNQKLKKTQKQLIQAEKLAALSKLSAKVAHEVNNPLGIIKNYISILLTKKIKRESKKNLTVRSPKDSSKMLRIIKEEVERIANILRELMELHRPKNKNPQLTDLVHLINQTCDLVEQQFKNKKISLVKKFYTDKARIVGYPDELKQVFLNLLLNSKDFMPDGGKIYVKLSKKNDDFKLEFSDTGKGISQKDLNEIFEPFFTTKSKTKGLGMGLWISRSIIEKHKGSIKAKSSRNSGATFIIKLPCRKKFKKR